MKVHWFSLCSERVRSLAFGSERSLFSFSFFFLISARDPSVIFFSLAPGFQTLTTFTPFIEIQRNQRLLLRYDPLYPYNQLKHVFEIFKI